MPQENPFDQETRKRFLRFLLVGGGSALIQFLSLAVWKLFFVPWLAFSLSFACSTTAHYWFNRFWALRSPRQDTVKQFGEYLVTVAISYFINLSAFTLCHDWLKLGVMWSAAIAIPPSTIVVFLLLHFRVFRTKA